MRCRYLFNLLVSVSPMYLLCERHYWNLESCMSQDFGISPHIDGTSSLLPRCQDLCPPLILSILLHGALPPCGLLLWIACEISLLVVLTPFTRSEIFYQSGT